MNDFERKLSQQPFRAPPADLRAALFGPEDAPANVILPPAWTWRDWLWPSPRAWAALAAVWLLFAALAVTDRPASATPLAADRAPVSEATLLSYHTSTALNHVLDLAN